MYDVRYDDQTKSEQYTFQRQARMTMAVWWLSSPEISAGTLPGSKNVRILPINFPILQAADICGETLKTQTVALLGAPRG